MCDGHDGHEHGHGSAVLYADSPDTLRDPEEADSAHLRLGLLSPAAVRNQVFSVVRLREGYDLAEVDTFLGLVEITLTTLVHDNEDLRGRLRAAVQAGRQARTESATAGRVVEIAHEAAERVVTLARQEAEAILAEARQQAEGLERESLERAVALQREVRQSQREALDRRIDDLQEFIDDFGSRLRESLNGEPDHLEALLEELRASAARDAPPPDGASSPPPPGDACEGNVGIAIFDSTRPNGKADG
ncbi:hypothetical protein GCM10009530_55490 [Microbispora corallina]|uniref:Cell wall synthesis protein Wag31 n=1 Tax=Microbispora corallina TaxID=83302 RepID=A0ABQ4G6Z3_9ACTN|nr:hypothetical protein Mco01_58480 [Microbispora corallina]